MKRFLCALLLLSSVVRAEGWEVNGSLDLRSAYVGWSAPSMIVDEPIIQPSLTLVNGAWFAGTWVSLHADRPGDVRVGDEFDLFVGGKWNFFGVEQKTTVLWFNVAPLDRISGDSFAIRNVATLPKIIGWTPEIMVEYNFAQNRRAGFDGWGYRIDFYKDVNVAGRVVNLDLALGGHDGEFGIKPEALSFARVTVTAPIGKWRGVTVLPYLMAQWGAGGMAENTVVGGVSFRW